MLSKSFSKLLLRLTAVLIASGAARAADCTPPMGPANIPDGNTASKEEMMAVHQAVQDYNEKTTEYTDCLLREFDASVAEQGDKLKDKDKKALEQRKNEKNDAAIDRLQKTAERFNEQVRVFNARLNAEEKAVKKNETAPAK